MGGENLLYNDMKSMKDLKRFGNFIGTLASESDLVYCSEARHLRTVLFFSNVFIMSIGVVLLYNFRHNNFCAVQCQARPVAAFLT